MRFHIAIMISAMLLGFARPASASSGQSIRTATSSTLPCSGTLKEYSFWEEDAYTSDTAVTLICQDKPDHALWMLEAGVGCRIDPNVPDPPNDPHLNGVCTKGLAEPNMRFLKSDEGDKTHHYHVGRYVYAKDCQPLSFSKQTTDDPANKVSSPDQEVGWACKSLTAIRKDGAVVDPSLKRFQYTEFTVQGEKGDEVLGGGLVPLLGATPDDTTYQVEYMNGKVFAR